MLNLTQNGDIYCIYLFESLWKWLIVLYHFIILPNVSVQISSKNCNTKKKKVGCWNILNKKYARLLLKINFALFFLIFCKNIVCLDIVGQCPFKLYNNIITFFLTSFLKITSLILFVFLLSLPPLPHVKTESTLCFSYNNIITSTLEDRCS